MSRKRAYAIRAIVAAVVAMNVFGPSWSASVKLDSVPRSVVSVDLHSIMFGDEYRRTLRIGSAGWTMRTVMMDDWGPAKRTSLYRIGDAEIAILGPIYDNYFFKLDPIRRIGVPGKHWSEWVYLGAFDFQSAGGGKRSFRFVPAHEQAECIPMLKDEPWPDEFRPTARARRCPVAQMRDAG